MSILTEYSDAFKGLSDPTRLKILWLLDDAGVALCVCEINDILETSHYHVSRNLKILKRCGILSEKRDGKWIFYFFREPQEPFFEQLRALVRAIPAHQFSLERKKCKRRLALREQGRCTVGVNSKRWQEIVRQLNATMGRAK